MKTRTTSTGRRGVRSLPVALALTAPLWLSSPALRADGPAPAGVTAAPDVTAGPYVLAPQDQLEVTVLGHEDLHQTVTVLDDGTIAYPIAGKLTAAGKTADALQADLTKGLSRIVKNPRVTVLVRQSHARKISVAGAVKTPGQYEYHPGMRLLELIAACGGPVAAPELTEATLVTDGGTQSHPIDLVKLMGGHDTNLNRALSPGDMLLLSPRDPAASMIQVVGQVEKPGQYPVMAGGATVLSVLTEAGGAAETAALTKAQLMHAGTVVPLDLHALKYDLNAPAGQRTLVAGDTLLIPENKQKVAVLGEVRTPGVYRIPDGEDLPITQALAQAGGAADSGDKKQVGILRLGPDGKRHLIAINMEGMLKGDTKVADADLQSGDILVVPTRRQKRSLGDYVNQVPGMYYITRLLSGGL